MLGRKAVTQILCFPNEPRTADNLGVPVVLDQSWGWRQCVEAMATEMGMQSALSPQTTVYTATGFEINKVANCIEGETVHIAWDGGDFFESTQTGAIDLLPGDRSARESRDSRASAESSSMRRPTDPRRGSELDHETAKTRLVMKFIIVGNQFVGKSCLLAQFANKQFPLAMSPTLGVDYNSSIIKVKNNLIKIQIWDTAGQEEHRAITRAYFRDSAAAIIVYDVTNPESFEALDSWVAVRSIATFCLCTIRRQELTICSAPIGYP